MSQINTSRIENQDTSAGATAKLTISPLNAVAGTAQETVWANKTGVFITGNSTYNSTGVVVDSFVKCFAGVCVDKNITHTSAPLEPYHLCNKAYVDGKIPVGWQNSVIGSGSTDAGVWSYEVNGASAAMIIGEYTDKWVGIRNNLVVTLYDSGGLGGVTLQTILLANVNEGANTSDSGNNPCDQHFTLPFAISIPSACRFAYFTCPSRQYAFGYGGSIIIWQHINRPL